MGRLGKGGDNDSMMRFGERLVWDEIFFGGVGGSFYGEDCCFLSGITKRKTLGCLVTGEQQL